VIILNEKTDSIALRIADRLGRDAFFKGKTNSPVLNKELMQIIQDEIQEKDKKESHQIMMDMMKSYLNAWMEEQLKKSNEEILKMGIL